MAITASTISSTQTLEEFRLEFNKLQSDVSTLESNPTYGTSITFEGATADAYETTLTVVDPTADRTITLPNATGTVLLSDAVNPASADGGSLGTTSLEWSDLYLADGGIIYFGADQDINITHVHNTGLTTSGNFTVTGDLTVTGDDLTMGTNTSGAALIADGTNFNPVVISGDISINTSGVAAIGSGVIVVADMAANSVDSAQYVDGSIDVAHMSADSVDSAQYVDGSIDTAHIAALQVTTALIAADAITAAKIADDVINSEHYAADSIDEEHIANDAVGSAELKTLSTLLIKNSSGSTLKTLYGAGA